MKKFLKSLLAIMATATLLGGTACQYLHTCEYGEWETVTEATCTEKGEQKRSCTCGKSETQEIPATGHSYGEDWLSDAENHWVECTNGACEEISEKAAHVWDDGMITGEPNGEGKIEKTYTCTVCEGTKTEMVAYNGVYVETAEELFTAAANGGEIALKADITIAEPLTLLKETVIYGCENTLTYTGTNRAIDVRKEANGADLTLVGLTVKSAASWSERGINYNTNGTLRLEDVTVEAVSQNYAVNLPSSSDGATVIINNSKITAFIALNVWGEGTNITINNSELYSVGNNEVEVGGTISINVDSGNRADNCTLTINGGKISSVFLDNETPAHAIRNFAQGTKIDISEETEMIGDIYDKACVATVAYPPYTSFYSYATLQAAVNKAAADYANGLTNAVVVLMEDITVDVLEIPSTVQIKRNGFSLLIMSITGDKSNIVWVE